MYRALEEAYGPQHWWPAKTATEVVIGAILAQNTAWSNVERAIANLRRARCLNFARLHALPPERLEALIKPAGTYRIKARRLKAFVQAICLEHGGSLRRMLSGKLDEARARLLAVHGIGPETADAILLYAGGRLSFVVDAYTMRILRRHFMVDSRATYEPVRSRFHRAMRPSPEVYNEFHALLVRAGKEHCRVRARCEGCPLEFIAHDERR